MKSIPFIGLVILTVLLVNGFHTGGAHADTFSGYFEESGHRSETHAFNLSKDALVCVKVTHASTMNPAFFKIKTTDDITIYTQDLGITHVSGTEHGPFALQEGSYHLYFTNKVNWGGHGSYTLTTRNVYPGYSNDHEDNDAVVRAEELNDLAFGHLGYAHPNTTVEDTGDFFKAELKKGEYCLEFFWDNTLQPWGFKVYDSEYVKLCEQVINYSEDKCNYKKYDKENGNVYHFVKPIPAEGTYFIKISSNWQGGGHGGYKIKCYKKSYVDTPPVITLVVPRNAQKNVDVSNPLVKVWFNQPMDPGSISPSTFTIRWEGLDSTLLPGEFKLAQSNIAHFSYSSIPENHSLFGRRFNCQVITNIKDLQGQPLQSGKTWWFETEGIYGPLYYYLLLLLGE